MAGAVNAGARLDRRPIGSFQERGLWTTSGSRTVFHNEGGTDDKPRLYKLQSRPNPLANRAGAG